MKRLAIVLALPILLTTGGLRADRPSSPALGIDSTSSASSASSLSEVKVTPEMWFYDQAMRRYNDPRTAVRANAEFRAEQRQLRLQSMKWFGLSNSRPRASSDPYHGDYSPGWVANAGYYPWRWGGVGQGGN